MTGRPRFKPTKQQRDRVKLLKAMGWSNERIAAQILVKGKPIARNTLEDRFADDLQFGADAKRLENIEAMEKAAKKGNASAGKWLAERYDAARAAEQVDARAQTAGPAPRQEKLGKKEARHEAANRVTGKFAPPPPPATKH
jgi:folate-binding Fe-S cluster repair protein YgfZ